MKIRFVTGTFLFAFAGFVGLYANMPNAYAAGEILGGNSHVQLNPIMATVQSKPGSFLTGIRPLMPTITVPKAGDVAFVCQRAPRVAESILYYFQKNPAPVLRNRHIDLDTLDTQKTKIAAFVNRALGRAAVSEVFLSEGGAKIAKGTASRMPFARIQGCSRVLTEFENRMKKLLNSAPGK